MGDFMSIYTKIYKEIKKAKKIVLARHIGPDPDALGSTLGLKELILHNFPDKEVYVIGSPASKFKFLGTLDKFNNDMYDGLLIVLDTPDLKRVDGLDVSKFGKSIKIDHHPFIEKMCDIEWVDEEASSASQMVIELAYYSGLKISNEAAFKLYAGLVSDTNRFLFKYANSKTFYLVSYLLKETDIDITEVYSKLYTRPYHEIKFNGYLSQNFTITENGVGYIIITEEILKEYNVDVATPGNMINDFNYIEEILIWVTFSYDKDIDGFRVSIRSRGPVINEVATKFGGGGHMYASGIRMKNSDDINKLVLALDEVAKKYMEK